MRTPNDVILPVQDDSWIMDDSGDGKGKDRPGVQKVGTASGGMGIFPGLDELDVSMELRDAKR